METLAAFDEALLRAARGAPFWALPFFVLLTTVGGVWGLLALVPFLAQRRARPQVVWLIGCLLSTTAIVTALKQLVGRLRPCNALVGCPAIYIASPRDYSFPSGHAAGSFAFAAFVVTTWPRFRAPAIVFATLVAWSRCFLGVHYPSDITVGAVLGVAMGFVFAKLSDAHAGGRLRAWARGSSRSESR